MAKTRVNPSDPEELTEEQLDKVSGGRNKGELIGYLYENDKAKRAGWSETNAIGGPVNPAVGIEMARLDRTE